MRIQYYLWALCTLLTVVLHAQLTIVVTALPANTPPGSTIYIAGNFNNWNPGSPAHILTPNVQGYHSITLNVSPGQLQFKFTRGSWATVEGTATGGFLPNRTYNYTGGVQTLTLTIAGWEGMSGSNSTAAPNVQIMSNNFPMPQLNRTRRIWVYLPPDYQSSNKRYPVLYMHDGQNLFDQSTSFAGEWRVDESLNALFQAGDPGIIVVGIDNGGANRINEYSPWVNAQYGGGQGDEYLEFIVQTLKPYIDSVYRTRPEREYTGLMGSSMGGLISHFGGVEYQQVFSKVGVFSPSYWFSSQCFSHTSQTGKQADMRFYLLAGQLESNGSVVAQVNAMYDTLQQAGFGAEELRKVFHADGQHSEWYWAREFPAAYQWLFAGFTATSTLDTSRPKSSGFSVFPNPANSVLYVSSSGGASCAHVALYHISGWLALPLRRVCHEDAIDISGLPQGMYVCVWLDGKERAGVQQIVVR